jgi:hypothetical protein
MPFGSITDFMLYFEIHLLDFVITFRLDHIYKFKKKIGFFVRIWRFPGRVRNWPFYPSIPGLAPCRFPCRDSAGSKPTEAD